VAAMVVEDGPALEEAGTATAPTPGFIPTSGTVDNATATPGSFRLSSSSQSLHLLHSHICTLGLSLPLTLPLSPSVS
jgi:hypothetical protein